MPKQTPLYAALVKAGAVFEEEAGWLMPAHFGDPLAEYHQALQNAALFDVSQRGKLEVTGGDAKRFLHNLCTNDVNALPPAGGCEAFLTTGQAKIVAYVLIYRLALEGGAEAFWLDVAPGQVENVSKHLDRYIISEQVELADRTGELSQLHLAGPQAKAVLQRAGAAPVPELAVLQHREQTFSGTIRSCLRRYEPLGLPGYDLLCPVGEAELVWRAVVGAGARPAGLEAYHILRIEAGTPLSGVDLDDSNLPQEVGRTEQAISFTKGCYIGQETVARIRTYGHVNRSLVGVKLAVASALPRGAKLYRDAKEVGYITSSAFSPRLQAGVALAYVRRGHEQPGTELTVDADGNPRRADMVPLPFIRSGC